MPFDGFAPSDKAIGGVPEVAEEDAPSRMVLGRARARYFSSSALITPPRSTSIEVAVRRPPGFYSHMCEDSLRRHSRGSSTCLATSTREHPETALAIEAAIRQSTNLAIIEAPTERDDDQALAEPTDP